LPSPMRCTLAFNGTPTRVLPGDRWPLPRTPRLMSNTGLPPTRPSQEGPRRPSGVRGRVRHARGRPGIWRDPRRWQRGRKALMRRRDPGHTSYTPLFSKDARDRRGLRDDVRINRALDWLSGRAFRARPVAAALRRGRSVSMRSDGGPGHPRESGHGRAVQPGDGTRLRRPGPGNSTRMGRFSRGRDSVQKNRIAAYASEAGRNTWQRTPSGRMSHATRRWRGGLGGPKLGNSNLMSIRDDFKGF